MKQFIDKGNAQLTKVKILQTGSSLKVQGTFPPKQGHGYKPRQYQISLGLKATKDNLKIAIAKAKEIESKLILEKWQWPEESEGLIFGEAIKKYTEHYWQSHKPTTNRKYSYSYNQELVYKYFPQDEPFTEKLLIDVIKSTPVSSYKRKHLIDNIRPVARFFNINIDYSQFGKYEKKPKTLPLLEDIIEAYQSETNERSKWLIGILFTFGLRPHEVFRGEYKFGDTTPKILIPENTKSGARIAYPLPIKKINFFDLPVPEFRVNLELPNPRLGTQISKRFIKYPFTAYQLRHYYAVRGAMEGIEAVIMATWMGHTLTEHYKSYASLLGEIESEAVWESKFGGRCENH